MEVGDGESMNYINIIALCFVVYSIIIVKKNEIPIGEYLKTGFNEYTKQDVIAGIFIGLLAMTGIYLVELNLNYIKIKSINFIDGKLIITFLELGLMAFGEELLFRGFMLNALLRILRNKYVAVIITAVLFGLAHASNPNATLISIISNGLGGVMYAVAFIESESIWLPTALHFAWNFFQGPVYGFPVSGLQFGGIVKQSFDIDKSIFAGGAYGPEGGIIGISFRIVVIVMLLLYYYLFIKKRGSSVKKSVSNF